MHQLQEDLNRHRSTIKDFPYYVHVTGTIQREGFYVGFTLSEMCPYYHGSRQRDIVAYAYCKLIPQLFNERIMIEIHMNKTKKEEGSPEVRFGEYNWYDQKWRYESFIMECSAIGIWHLLENNINHMTLIEEIMDK